jgi:hypothetical protein
VVGRLPLRAKARAKARTKRMSRAVFMPVVHVNWVTNAPIRTALRPTPPRRLEAGPPLRGVTKRRRAGVVLPLASHAESMVAAILRTSGS